MYVCVYLCICVCVSLCMCVFVCVCVWGVISYLGLVGCGIQRSAAPKAAQPVVSPVVRVSGRSRGVAFVFVYQKRRRQRHSGAQQCRPRDLPDVGPCEPE